MFYNGWVASAEGIICHRCDQRPTQSGEPETQSLSDVFGDKSGRDDRYLTLEARRDHRYCPHTTKITKDGVWTNIDSYSHRSSCPECDPGPLNGGDVRRGHSIVAVVTGSVRSQKPDADDNKTTDERALAVTDGGEDRC